MSRTDRTLIILFLACALCALTARAAIADQDGHGNDFSAVLSGGGQTSAEVGETKGTVQATAAGVELSYSYFSMKWQHHAFDFEHVGKLPLGNGKDDPWSDLTELELSAHYDAPLGDQWAYFVGASVGAGFEEEMGGALEAMAYAGLGYSLTPELMLRLGAGVSHDAVETGVVPLVALDWKDPGTIGLSASIGVPETHVQFRWNEAYALRLAASMDGGLYRLADDSTVQRKGYLEIDGYKAGLYLDWTPSENLALIVGPEYVFGRSYTVYNEDGHEMDDYDVDPALGGALWITYSF